MMDDAVMCSRAVIGVGNPMRADDGVGIRLIEDLRERIEDCGADAIELGTDAFGLIDWMTRCDDLLVIDAVEMGEAPGAMRIFDVRGEVSFRTAANLTPHAIDIAAAFEAARQLRSEQGCEWRVALLGIQPGSTDLSMELSPELRERWETIVERALKSIQKWSGPQTPDHAMRVNASTGG